MLMFSLGIFLQVHIVFIYVFALFVNLDAKYKPIGLFL